MPRGGPGANLFRSGLLQCVVIAGPPGYQVHAAEGDEQSGKTDYASPQDTVYNSDFTGPAPAADGASDKV